MPEGKCCDNMIPTLYKTYNLNWSNEDQRNQTVCIGIRSYHNEEYLRHFITEMINSSSHQQYVYLANILNHITINHYIWKRRGRKLNNYYTEGIALTPIDEKISLLLVVYDSMHCEYNKKK